MGTVQKILCYGDSLTAGYCCKGLKFIPYSTSLKQTLSDEYGLNVDIHHHGYSGWTAREMKRCIDEENVEDFTGNNGPGLRTALQKNYDLLILMAGTNDLGFGESVENIFENIRYMMDVSLQRKISVLNIGIPDSSCKVSVVTKKRDSVNTLLKKHAKTTPNLTYITCPVEYSKTSGYYDPDGLHFSESGYSLLGRELGKHVFQSLNVVEK